MGTICGGRSGKRSKLSNCVASAGFSLVCRCASSWMRAGVSSFAHSDAQRGDGVTLALDFQPHLREPLGLHGQVELDLVDMDRRRDEQAARR